MKTFKEVGMKVADNPKEAMLETAIKSIEQKIMQEELGIEIDKVVIEYLKNKRKI